ncbi:MAG TPA: tripartite tricarboxylate transporter substrate-binding protein, partial [Usitatibacter sp.]|nr:tripartite tricarboxylate transporter substrate-binding protein [Usitatibacter sp.]
EAVGWFGLFAPAATPKDIVDNMSADANRVLADPDVKRKMVAAGAEPSGMTPEAFARFVRSEMAKWARLMKERGIQVE